MAVIVAECFIKTQFHLFEISTNRGSDKSYNKKKLCFTIGKIASEYLLCQSLMLFKIEGLIVRKNSLYREANIFFVAVTVLTRLPVPRWVSFNSDYLGASSRYFPLVGLGVGVIVALVYTACLVVFTKELSILFSMVIGVLVTGAFHEDGFADSCDGFGAGGEKSQIITIMKDSRVGTYGVVGLVLLLAIKFFVLVSYPIESIAFVMVLAHGVSRLVSVSFMYNCEYVQDDSLSKVNSLADKIGAKALLFSLVSVLPLFLGLSVGQVIILVAGLLIFRYLAEAYLYKRIGGYTGDCLGAVQQLAEVLVYLLLFISI